MVLHFGELLEQDRQQLLSGLSIIDDRRFDQLPGPAQQRQIGGCFGRINLALTGSPAEQITRARKSSDLSASVLRFLAEPYDTVDHTVAMFGRITVEIDSLVLIACDLGGHRGEIIEG